MKGFQREGGSCRLEYNGTKPLHDAEKRRCQRAEYSRGKRRKQQVQLAQRQAAVGECLKRAHCGQCLGDEDRRGPASPECGLKAEVERTRWGLPTGAGRTTGRGRCHGCWDPGRAAGRETQRLKSHRLLHHQTSRRCAARSRPPTETRGLSPGPRPGFPESFGGNGASTEPSTPFTMH